MRHAHQGSGGTVSAFFAVPEPAARVRFERVRFHLPERQGHDDMMITPGVVKGLKDLVEKALFSITVGSYLHPTVD